MFKSIYSNKNFALLICMLLISITAYALRPTLKFVEDQGSQAFMNAIPTSFADWKEVESNQIQIDLVPRKEDGSRSMDSPYDDTLMRTYVNSKGEVVQLALAYGRTQRQEVKIHRPELCYYAQGFEVKSLVSSDFNITSTHQKPIIGKNMLVVNPAYQEAVSYWIRIGDIYSESPWQTRFYIIKKGLTGDVVDGILVRASSTTNDGTNAKELYQRNQLFLKTLVANIQSEQVRNLLIQ